MQIFSFKISRIVFFILTLWQLGAANSAAMPLAFKQEVITIKTETARQRFNVEIAQTPEQQQLGLMYRKHMDEGRGMLFLFTGERPVSMWMKNTLIPLDMFFFSPQGSIVHIAENTQPESTTRIETKQPVSAVLELNAGAAKKYGIKVGDTLSHIHFTVRP